MIASDDFNIQLVVGGMEQKGWRLLGVSTPPAIHLTIDVMSDEALSRFVTDLDDVSARITDQAADGRELSGGIGYLNPQAHHLTAAHQSSQ